jgi:small subunit ribosomal protein S24e
MDIKDVHSEKLVLPRKEAKIKLSFTEAAPSRKQLKKMVAEKLKAKEDMVIIRHVYTKYGTKDAEIIVFVYDNEEALKSLEYGKMVQKNSDKKPEVQA